MYFCFFLKKEYHISGPLSRLEHSVKNLYNDTVTKKQRKKGMTLEQYENLPIMEGLLDGEDRARLKAIYAPKTVLTPPEDSRRSICVMADGELRTYGRVEPTAENPKGVSAYYASRDCGLSWKLHYNHGAMLSATWFPKAGRYIGIKPETEDGTFVYLSDIGPGDPDPRVVKVSDLAAFDCFSPVGSAYSDRIWFTGQVSKGYHKGYLACFFYSDDFGESWKVSSVDSPCDMPVTYPDKGFRWVNCGVEPNAAEIDENTVMMLLRNGWDAFYVTYSHDRGESWSEPIPSTFYGHATTPCILRLSDGRVVTFWNNTKILPEVEHSSQVPPQPECITDGTWEDVFTNRDAAHAAISEDGGKSWIGYREILLNPYRNNADFRTVGAEFSWTDKSVHQFQAVELPYGKVLVSIGQSPAVRRLVVFDPKWLYETQASEDFRRGLTGVTTHQYLYSTSGSGNDINFGHCSWNRLSGAVMCPDPEDTRREAVHISRVEDPRIMTKTQGVVWNFPMMRAGEVTAEIRIAADRLRISLSDRWYNACDDQAICSLPYWFELDARDIGTGFTRLRILCDVEKSFAEVFAADRLLFRILRHAEVPTGISYLMLQCIAPGESEGSYIRRLTKK